MSCHFMTNSKTESANRQHAKAGYQTLEPEQVKAKDKNYVWSL